MGSSRFWLKAADEESKSIPHGFPSSHWLKATGHCVLERYLSATMSSIEVSDWLNLSHVMPSNDRPVASQSDVAEILSKRFRFKCDLQKGARSLKM